MNPVLKQQNPSDYQQLYYGQIKENPSYGSDYPRNFTYDPGATSTVTELGYVTTNASIIPLLIILVFVGAITYYHLRKGGSLIRSIGIMGLIAAILAFFGPLVIAGPLPFQTTLGLAKAFGAVVIFGSLIKAIYEKKLDIVRTPASIPIAIYIVSLFLPVFRLTNIEFFVADLTLIFGGILFYCVGFWGFPETEDGKRLAKWLMYLLIFPSLLVLTVLFFESIGVDLINSLYPRYENIVFSFDLARGRILSIIDLEFFVPFVLYGILTWKNRKYIPISLYVLTALAVFLTNYRYRFLTFLAGSATQMFYVSVKERKWLIRLATILFVGAFGVYVAFSLATDRNSLVDRFLLTNYQNDVDSLNRRVVLAGQAIDLFRQYPLLGVGLGNYKDNVQVVYESFGGRFYEPDFKILENVYAYPHNWFLQVLAENGIVGFAILLYLLFTFYKTDRELYRRLKGDGRYVFIPFSVASWLFVFANQFTPLQNSEQMVMFFWLFRGIIERMYLNTTKNLFSETKS